MTPPRPTLAVLVAPNGLGHFRRVVAVLAELVTSFTPVPELHLFAETWARDRMAGWAALDALEAAAPTWVPGVMAPGVTWSTRVEDYRDGRLLAWIERLREHDVITTAELVVSDNLGGTLAVRPDAVLMGSFLWSDVLADAHAGDRAVDEFVALERTLLATHRPPMVCVGDMALPGVLARTDAVEVGWMVDAAEPADPSATRVAVLGGRTGAADVLLVDAARALVERGVDVTVDPALADAVPSVVAFPFGDAAWADLGAVVCRPGMGTLTECVARRLPLVTLCEAGNSELAHNGAAIARLGLGADAGVEPDPASVAQLTVELLADRGGTIRRRMSSLNTHGIAQAATFLADRLDLHRTDPRHQGPHA